jgi:predicted nucleotidyltransferase
MALTDSALADLAHRLLTVPGVVGVVLGGSRARGTHTEDSDTDLGLYYRAPLDTGRLGELAREVAGYRGDRDRWLGSVGGRWRLAADRRASGGLGLP